MVVAAGTGARRECCTARRAAGRSSRRAPWHRPQTATIFLQPPRNSAQVTEPTLSISLMHYRKTLDYHPDWLNITIEYVTAEFIEKSFSVSKFEIFLLNHRRPKSSFSLSRSRVSSDRMRRCGLIHLCPHVDTKHHSKRGRLTKHYSNLPIKGRPFFLSGGTVSQKIDRLTTWRSHEGL